MTNPNPKRDYWPTKGWQTSTPEEQGVDSVLLAKACDFIFENELNIHSMLVIRHGYIIADAYFSPFTPNTLHDLASCTKSFTSTLVGIAIDRGYIKSVRQPVLELLKGREVANVDARKEAMTLENLLTMSTGMACYAEPGEITLNEMFQSSNWEKFTLDLPMIEEPGTRFEYCSPGSYLLSDIVQETTGMTTLDFARQNLFEPLGITEVIWPASAQGINHGWGDLHLTPHDMAKLGYLFLNNGYWNGKQIISSEWVTTATSNHATPPDNYGYGYQWWLLSPEIYSALGRGGQMIIVLPNKDTVVVLTGGLGEEEGVKRDQMLETILRTSLKSNTPLPPNPEGLALLESSIKQATLPGEKPEAVPPMPQMAKKISGQNYILDRNMLGLQSISVTFTEEKKAVLTAFARGESLKLDMGLDNVSCINQRGRFDLPTALKGAWEGDNTFTIHWNEIANINHWQIRMTFENDRVSIQMQEATWHTPAVINGILKQ